MIRHIARWALYALLVLAGAIAVLELYVAWSWGQL